MKEEYDALKKKHKLPTFELLDTEFEISSIEEKNFVLRNIRKKMFEKIDFAIGLIDDVLHPESGFANYHEATILSQDERESLLNVYRRLMYYNRLAVELTFADSDDLNSAFINDFVKEWPEIRKSLLFFVRKLKDSWQKDVIKKETVGYLG